LLPADHPCLRCPAFPRVVGTMRVGRRCVGSPQE
jgi:hypothetical protein